MKNETVIVLDFGGQYNQLIARRVRECNVYCEIYSYKKNLEEIKAMNPKGIILTALTVRMRRIHRHTIKNCSSLEYRCLGFVTVHS